MQAYEMYVAAREQNLRNPVSRIARQLAVARESVQRWKKVHNWPERYEQRKAANREAISEACNGPVVEVKLAWATRLKQVCDQWWEYHCGTKEKLEAYVVELSLEQFETLLALYMRFRGEPDVLQHLEARIVHEHSWIDQLGSSDANALLGFARAHAAKVGPH
jgi:hypothetical protein